MNIWEYTYKKSIFFFNFIRDVLTKRVLQNYEGAFKNFTRKVIFMNFIGGILSKRGYSKIGRLYLVFPKILTAHNFNRRLRWASNGTYNFFRFGEDPNLLD